jgi:hypothetical protein
MAATYDSVGLLTITRERLLCLRLVTATTIARGTFLC